MLKMVVVQMDMVGGRSGGHGDDGGGVGCGDSTSLQVTKSLHQLFCLHYVSPPAATTHNTTWRSPPRHTLYASSKFLASQTTLHPFSNCVESIFGQI